MVDNHVMDALPLEKQHPCLSGDKTFDNDGIISPVVHPVTTEI
jgi:hypothetical protein